MSDDRLEKVEIGFVTFSLSPYGDRKYKATVWPTAASARRYGKPFRLAVSLPPDALDEQPAPEDLEYRLERVVFEGADDEE